MPLLECWRFIMNDLWSVVYKKFCDSFWMEWTVLVTFNYGMVPIFLSLTLVVLFFTIIWAAVSLLSQCGKWLHTLDPFRHFLFWIKKGVFAMNSLTPYHLTINIIPCVLSRPLSISSSSLSAYNIGIDFI